mmetsp:Transcript_77931/g.252752  ORF Transcript_77931/g.252752 Transcript_77931/m.252752 type:complete len:231 (-) Transcript_77931:503-1195(-)
MLRQARSTDHWTRIRCPNASASTETAFARVEPPHPAGVTSLHELFWIHPTGNKAPYGFQHSRRDGDVGKPTAENEGKFAQRFVLGLRAELAGEFRCRRGLSPLRIHQMQRNQQPSTSAFDRPHTMAQPHVVKDQHRTRFWLHSELAVRLVVPHVCLHCKVDLAALFQRRADLQVAGGRSDNSLRRRAVDVPVRDPMRCLRVHFMLKRTNHHLQRLPAQPLAGDRLEVWQC